MKRLSLLAFRVLVRRWLRGWGYRGGRTGLVAGGTAVVAVVLDLLVAVWIRQHLPAIANGPAWLSNALASVGVAGLVLLAGPVLLLTESIRSKGSRLTGALGTLPLTPREIALLTWLPTAAVSVVMLALLLAPGTAFFSTLGFSLPMGLLLTALSLTVGYVLAMVAAGLIRTTLGRGGWVAVQYPAMLLAWMGLMALAIWQTSTLNPARPLSVIQGLLLEPWLVKAVMAGTIPAGLIVAITSATVLAATLLVLSAVRAPDVMYPDVAFRWNRRRRPMLVTLELTRMLRSRDVVANAVGAELAILGLGVVLSRAPLEVRGHLADVFLPAMLIGAVIPVLAIRGLTRSRWPVPLLLGISPARWTAAQVAAGLLFVIVMTVPGIILLFAEGASFSQLIGPGFAYGVLSVGFAVAAGWLAPASPENPIGQVVNAFVMVFTLTVIEAVAYFVLTTATPAWYAVTLALGGLGVACAFYVESQRWAARRNHGAHIRRAA